jgi:hypothetical protein
MIENVKEWATVALAFIAAFVLSTITIAKDKLQHCEDSHEAIPAAHSSTKTSHSAGQ